MNIKVMEHFNRILFHTYGTANKQHNLSINQSINQSFKMLYYVTLSLVGIGKHRVAAENETPKTFQINI